MVILVSSAVGFLMESTVSRDFFMGHADFAVGPVVAGKRGFSLGLYPIEQ